jgi:CRISPR/Cas system-associated exonuclease Cas4 (RecB family)
MRGNIDVLIITESNQAIVIDHKTGKRKPIIKHKVQLDTYLLFALAHFPEVLGLQAAIHSLAYNNELDWATTRSAEYVTSVLQPWLLQYLTQQATGVETIQAKITPLCGWCNYRNNCAEWLAHAETKQKH